jgi:hypothetical protein
MSVSTDFLAVFFPYCIEKQRDDSWVVLNRQYKPVGFNTSEYISYDQLRKVSSLCETKGYWTNSR